MAKKQKKTQSMRVLEANDIPYERIDFPPLSDATAVADYAGVPHGNVYKTLVAKALDDGFKPMLVMIASHRSLDLKKLAQVIGAKKTAMTTKVEAEKLTGLQTGGISALALLNRGFAVYIDETVAEIDYILVSAGKRGTNLRLAPDALIRVTEAEIVDVGTDE